MTGTGRVHVEDASHPPEVRSLARWFTGITNWHKAFISNGPTEE